MPAVNYPEMDSDTQSTTEMFKDMLNQKRNLLFSKLTSFDSDVSIFHLKNIKLQIMPHNIYTYLPVFLNEFLHGLEIPVG